MDKLSALSTFRRVAERGSFSAAARDLGVSNASVSKQIAELERTLGVQLILRTTRRLSLTEAGRQYFAEIAAILDQLAEADRALVALQSSPRGLLRVNAPMSFGLRHLAPVLPDFMARFPEIRVDLALNDRLVDLVEEGFDVALRIRTTLPDSTLTVRRLAHVRRVLCAAPALLARYPALRAPEDLRSLPGLAYTLSASPGTWTLRHQDTGEERSILVDAVFRCNSSIAIREALLAGVGATVIPDFVIAADLAEGRLVELLPDWKAAGHDLHAVYPSGRHLPSRARVFLDFLIESFGHARARGFDREQSTLS